jgi:hypothetical protein
MSVAEKTIVAATLRDACTMLIEPFFAYANDNRSEDVVLKWKDPEVSNRMELVYKKCIMCGKERLSSKDLSSPSRMRMSTFSRHCDSCNEQLVMTAARVARAAKKEGFITFNQVFNDRVESYEKKFCKKEHKSL